MSADIVAQLRKAVYQNECPLGDELLMESAADEIERLRFWVIHLREGDTWCGQRQDRCDVCRMYERAVMRLDGSVWEAAGEILRLLEYVNVLSELRWAEHFYWCPNEIHGKCLTEAVRGD